MFVKNNIKIMFWSTDEMYAAIEEASVGEGSDTYAQIATEPRRRDPTPDLLHTDPTHAAR